MPSVTVMDLRDVAAAREWTSVDDRVMGGVRLR